MTTPNKNPEEKYSNSKLAIKLPLLMCLMLAGGVWIGATMFGGKGILKDDLNTNIRRISEVIQLMDREYVDTINVTDITNYGISQMLDKLDPHSVFIPAKEVAAAKEPLEGNFDGIGVEFYIMKDTIEVVSAIAGGPSEAVGVRAGDKIVSVDGKNMAGIGVTNKDVFSKLRGPKGTKVNVGIKRRSEAKPLDFTITRAKIPVYSVDISYMVDKTTGFIKISRFAATTHDEFLKGLDKLKALGMKQLIVDLRDNSGGYLDQAVKIVNEFLPADRMVVYTKSKDGRYNSEFKSTGGGGFDKGLVCVLINDGSASASEIVSGALQDNDRAVIVGRRSFGKGLVQRPLNLSDGSELRLTISRYYTPSGRSIQKSYQKGVEDYEMDYFKRYKHGELFHADSIKFNDSLKFSTISGRTVYGGGGIMPDIFVPYDTTGNSKYFAGLFNKNIVREFSMQYADENKATLLAMTKEQYQTTFTVTPDMLAKLRTMGEKAGVIYDEKQFKTSEARLTNFIKALIGRATYREEGFYPVIFQQDNDFKMAMKAWPKAKEILTAKPASVKPTTPKPAATKKK